LPERNALTQSYDMAGGTEATYGISQNGKATVSVSSISPMKPRAVYVGTAILEFMWVSSGKSSHWQFTPTLLDPTPAEFTQTTTGDGKRQISNVELGNRMFPATGIIKTNVTGEIRAPAVHFDLPNAFDLWIILLRSPWYPLKVNVEKSPLSISHDGAEAMAEVSSISFDDGKSIRIDVSSHGEGFKRVWLTLKRNVNRASTEEFIGELTEGIGSFTWRPFQRNFDVALATHSNMSLNDFLGFLNYLGANSKQSFFSLGTYLPSDFLLCDGPTMNYTLSIKGEKHFIGHEEDKTKITLN
jgi:hypothetical protein